MSVVEDGQISDPTKKDVHTVDAPDSGGADGTPIDISNADGVTQSDPIVEGDHVDPSNEMVDGDTFPRDYVLKLRDENAKYRQRAQDRDELAKQLHTALVTATGRLQDPSDLAFDEDHLRDLPRMVAAIDDLLATKPHLASRKPAGDIGQGVSVASDTFSLLGALRTNAS